MLKEKLTETKHELIKYAQLVEDMIRESINGFLQKDEETLDKVIEEKEPRANDYEIELDEMCLSLIAQFQPAAGDLRAILMILKINNDLERIGDLAVNMSTSFKCLLDRPTLVKLADTPQMAEAASKMLKDSIKAFVDDDVELADDVCKRDDFVDKKRDKIWRDIISDMLEDPDFIERGLYLMTISRILERIADLSTNIAEDVIFMVEGAVIKHHKEELGK